MEKSFGLVGYPLKHSLSPYIHNKLFSIAKNKNRYSLFEVPKGKIDSFLKNAKNLDGFNVTMPYKNFIYDKIENKSKIALKLKTTNLVVKEKKQFKCYNTDFLGFKESLKYLNIKPFGNILLLGLGGAARAILIYLIYSSCLLYIAVRKTSLEKAKKTINLIVPLNFHKKIKLIDIEKIPKKQYNIIINATPIGMQHINKMPINFNLLFGCKLAIDLIYSPFETKFLKAAKQLKIRRLNGLFMLLTQAIKTNEIFIKTKFKKNTIFKLQREVKKILNK